MGKITGRNIYYEKRYLEAKKIRNKRGEIEKILSKEKALTPNKRNEKKQRA